VVTETFEQARAAAHLVRVEYVSEKGAFDLASAKASAIVPIKGTPDTKIGDFAGAFAMAPVKIDAMLTTPDQSHAIMEPYAATAAWVGDELTRWTSSQMIGRGHGDMSRILGIPKEKIRLISHFIGGGFGGKLLVQSEAVLASLGARAAKRAVKVALARPLIFNNTTHRPATLQRMRIWAGRDGKITAIAHESWSGNLPRGRTENAVQATRVACAGAHRMTTTRLAVLDLPEGSAMRAPGETPGSMALEIAMDEMAEKLKLDPVHFRIINDTKVDPENPSRAFSQRSLITCLRTGAEKFGWNARSPKPATVRDGRWLVGMGVAGALRNNVALTSAARVRLDRSGIVTVETDMTDIGTGSYTIIAQSAAEMMDVGVDKVIVRLGDSNFPVSSGSGGQFGANASTSGGYAACVKLRAAVLQQLKLDPTDARFSQGLVHSGQRSLPLAAAAEAGELVAEDVIEFGDSTKRFQQSTFAAHFVEVGVDAATGEIKVRRMLAVCASGRILNPKTARSQVLGGMTMGVGAALMEHLVIDKRKGFFVNHDLAGYEVPVHADIPQQEVIFIDELDPMSSPIKAKGVGELGICGMAAAVANAIYNTTGVRVRDYPITLDKLLTDMPEYI
jgi:xanthine dehydrogenase YagR molybdenum-binding subunit